MSDQSDEVMSRLDRLEEAVQILEERIDTIYPRENVAYQSMPALSKPADGKNVAKTRATNPSVDEKSFVETEETEGHLTNVGSQASQVAQAESKSRGLKRRRSEKRRRNKSDQSLRKKILSKLNF